MANVSDWTKEDQAEMMSRIAKKYNRLRWKNSSYRRKMLRVLRKGKRARILGYRKKFDSFRSKLVERGKELWESHKDDPEFQKLVHESHKYPSAIQISIFKSLCARRCKGIRLEHVVSRYSVDIAHPKKKIAVEVDGKYWHRDKSKERTRDRCLRKLGWKVIHVKTKLSEAIWLSEVLRGKC